MLTLSLIAFLCLACAQGAELDLILYGATGCVGHLAAQHLAAQPSLSWAIADRNATKLAELAATLAASGGASSHPKTIVASQDGSTDLEEMVSRARAVASAAGPFSVHGGERLVSACAAKGVHYVDTSDEFYWQRWMIDRYHTQAEQSGASIVLAAGFSVLAGDIGAQLALQSISGEPADVHLDAWLSKYNGGLSAGVINTGKALHNASFPKEWSSDPYVLTPNISSELKVDSTLDGMHYPGWADGPIVSNIFGPYDARLLRRTFAERNQRVHLRVGARPKMYTDWTGFLAMHPKSWSSLTACPSAALLQGGSWQYDFTATANSSKSVVHLSGAGDPGYNFTSAGLAEAGLCLAGKTVGCFTHQAGVRTSMSTMDAAVMAKRLEHVGLMAVSTEYTQLEL